jgi:hypothetical protein
MTTFVSRRVADGAWLLMSAGCAPRRSSVSYAVLLLLTPYDLQTRSLNRAAYRGR